MKIAMPARRHPRTVAIAIVLLAILVVTLTPSGSGSPSQFSFAFTFGRRGLADGILNFFLFLPLGLAFGWSLRPIVIAGLSGLLVATLVELAQMIIPGRDPALSDIIFNTAGSLVGAFLARHRQRWLVPSERDSVVLTASSISVAALLMIVTTFLLTPLEKPTLVERAGDDVLFRYHSRANALGLDQPEHWVSNMLDGSASAETASMSRDRGRWHIAIGRNRATVGPTVGQGWTLLAYPDAIGRRWGSVVNAAWMFVICFPVGFWARRRVRLIAAIFVVVIVAFIPVITGVVATSLVEWVGAVVGFLAGASLGNIIAPVVGALVELKPFREPPRRFGPAHERIE
jgi:glycopeptide antibiotics resistance protein